MANDDTIQLQIIAKLGELQSTMAQATSIVRASTAEMSESLRAVERTSEETSRTMREGFDSIGEHIHGAVEHVKTLIETLALIEGVHFLTETIKGGLEGAEALSIMSRKTGESVESLSKLKFIAEASGVSFERFGTMIGILDQKLNLVREHQGGAALNQAFSNLGIDSSVKTAGEAIDRAVDSINRLGHTPTIIGDVRTAFGKMGQDLLVIAPNFKILGEEAERTNAVLKGSTAAAAVQVQEEFNKLGAIWDAAKVNLAVSLRPALLLVVGVLDAVATKANQLSQSGSLEGWARSAALAIINLAEEAVPAIEAVFSAIEYLGKGVKYLSDLADWNRRLGNSFTELYLDLTGTDDQIAAFAGTLGTYDAAADVSKSKTSALTEVLEGLKAKVSAPFTAPSTSGTDPDATLPHVETAKEIAAAKKALEERFAAFKVEQEQEVALAGSTAIAKIAADQRVLTEAIKLFGAHSKEALSARLELFKAEVENKKQLASLDDSGIANDVKNKVATAASAKQLYQLEFDAKAITKAQELQLDKDVDDQIYQIERNGLEKRLALVKDDIVKTRALKQEEIQLDLKHNGDQLKFVDDMLKAQNDAAEKTRQVWDSVFSSIAGSATAAIDAAIQGGSKSESTGTALKKLLISTAEGQLKNILQGALTGGPQGTLTGALFGQGLSGLLAGVISPNQAAGKGADAGFNSQTVSQAFRGAQSAITDAFRAAMAQASAAVAPKGGGGAAAPTADASVANSPAAKAAVQSVSILSSIASATHASGATLAVMSGLQQVANVFLEIISIYTVFNAVKASIAGFSFAGGGLVPSAAGGMVVGGGMLSVLHEKEMVLPRHLSEGVQGLINSGGRQTGDTHNHIHYSPTVNALDSADVEDFFSKNRSAMTRHIQGALRDANIGYTR